MDILGLSKHSAGKESHDALIIAKSLQDTSMHYACRPIHVVAGSSLARRVCLACIHTKPRGNNISHMSISSNLQVIRSFGIQCQRRAIVPHALQHLRLQDVGEGSKSARQAVAVARAAAEEGLQGILR